MNRKPLKQVETLTPEQFHLLLESKDWEDANNDYEPLGYYIIHEENCIVACDNSTGEAWTEEFETTGEAVAWLFNEEERPDPTETEVFDYESAVMKAREIKNVKTDWRKALEIIEYLQMVNLDDERRDN